MDSGSSFFSYKFEFNSILLGFVKADYFSDLLMLNVRIGYLTKICLYIYANSRFRHGVENIIASLYAVLRVLRKSNILEPDRAVIVMLTGIYLHSFLRKNNSSVNRYIHAEHSSTKRKDIFFKEAAGKTVNILTRSTYWGESVENVQKLRIHKTGMCRILWKYMGRVMRRRIHLKHSQKIRNFKMPRVLSPINPSIQN